MIIIKQKIKTKINIQIMIYLKECLILAKYIQKINNQYKNYFLSKLSLKHNQCYNPKLLQIFCH